MARYQVILAYDGAGFYGFQRQSRDLEHRSGDVHRTVQATVETALRRLGWTGERVLSAGRTDTGVHASGQVIAFDLDWRHSDDELLRALNANLPSDVAVQQVRAAAADFHPRYAARLRRYRYRLFCRAERHPIWERYAWRVWPPVDIDRLHAAAQALPGRADFAAFGSPPRTGGSTIRTVEQAEWRPDPGLAEAAGWIFEITANAFLYHMVRRLVGFQIAIGQGLYPTEALAALLQDPAVEVVQTLAPPHGLELVEVIYKRDLA